MTRRQERLASTIRQELAMMLLRDLTDPRLEGMPSITRVKVSQDLSFADVYVVVMGSEGKQNAALTALKHAAGMMRTKLTKALHIRQTPYLRFHLDEQYRKELAVLEAIQRTKDEQRETEETEREETEES